MSNSGEVSGRSGSGRGGVSSEESEGEDEEPSSSHFLEQQMASVSLGENTQNDQVKTSVEAALSNFRQQWQKELESPVKTVKQTNASNKADSADPKAKIIETDEEKAKTLFLKGADYERNGELYEAIKFYKRAVQLVPDIELRIYENTKMKTMIKNDTARKTPESSNVTKKKDVEAPKEVEAGDVLANIGKIVLKNGYMCVPAFDQKSTHISELPKELVMYILRWVVSGELDMVSLERFASVCRGFYVLARDSEIWRLACVKTWGINCGTLESNKCKTWRQMYVERPRLRINGCYISVTTYMRPGENSFQDQFYRPWHFIKYFRYLRFFPDGIVLMMTTPDEPIMCLDRLIQRYSLTQGVLSGHYRLNGDKVVIVVGKSANGQNKQTPPPNTRFRSRKKDNSQEPAENTFHLELQLKSHNPQAVCSLVWRNYTVFTKNNITSAITLTNFEIVKNKFPSFKFRKVDKFHAKSDGPLQQG
ncbi:F-box only protein 9 [Arctopsyche grandis]|uniref:F-box only protein 9 n=1 Tax=Arctopsyche grandis TaxID=121162 RepID=UPI00406D7BB5